MENLVQCGRLSRREAVILARLQGEIEEGCGIWHWLIRLTIRETGRIGCRRGDDWECGLGHARSESRHEIDKGVLDRRNLSLE